MTETARFLVRHRWLLAAAVAVAAFLAGSRAARLEFDFSFRPFFLESEQDQLSIALAERFPDAGASHVVAIIHADDVFRPELLQAIERMSGDIAGIPAGAETAELEGSGAGQARAFKRVYSLSRTIVAEADGEELPLPRTVEHHLSVYRELPVATRTAKVAALRAHILGDDLYAGRIVSKDGAGTLVMAVLAHDHQKSAARQDAIEAFESAVTRNLAGIPGATVQFTGYPIAEVEYRRLVCRGFLIAQVVGVALVGIGLFVCFRSAVAVILPLAVIALATLLTMGFMEVAGQKITLMNASVPLLLLVVGIAELAFFMACYHEEAARPGTTREGVVVRATAHVLPPGFMGLATASLGFLSLGAGSVPLTRDFGVTMAFGNMAIFVLAVALVPGALCVVPLPRRSLDTGVAARPTSRLILFVTTVVLEHRRMVAAGALACAAFGLVGALRMDVEQYVTRELPEDNPVRRAAQVVDAKFGGAFQTWVGVRMRHGGPILHAAALSDIEALQEFLTEQEERGVVRAVSMADHLKEMNMLAHEGDADERRLPADDRLTSLFAQELAGAGEGADVSLLIGPSDDLVMIVLGTTDIGAKGLLVLHESVQEFVRTKLGDRLEVRFLGDYWRASLGVQSLLRDLVVTLAISFLLVFGLVGLFFRSVPLTLISIPSNLLPLAAALGFMAVTGIALRVGPSIILPIALGIAVTDTVHCLVRLREEWDETHEYATAVRRTLAATGRAIVYSDMVLVVGFLALLIPEFLAFGHMGILGSFTLFAALVADLLLLPALVLWFRPFGSERRTAPALHVSGNGHRALLQLGPVVRKSHGFPRRPVVVGGNGMRAYLARTRYCDWDDPSILAAVVPLLAEGKSERETAVRLFRFVRDDVAYTFAPWGVPASATLACRQGMCSNKNNLLVALFRAAGISAAYGVLRVNAQKYFGNVAPPFFASALSVNSTHIYAAAYLDGGWIKCDSSTDSEMAAKTGHFCRQTQLVEWDGASDALDFLDPLHVHEDLGLRPSVDDLLDKRPRRATPELFAAFNGYLQFIRSMAPFPSSAALIEAYVRSVPGSLGRLL